LRAPGSLLEKKSGRKAAGEDEVKQKGATGKRPPMSTQKNLKKC